LDTSSLSKARLTGSGERVHVALRNRDAAVAGDFHDRESIHTQHTEWAQQRVHQPYSGGGVEQTADRADEVADAIDTLHKEHFNPCLKFHRPCGVPELKKNSKGKTRRAYKWYATPCGTLSQLPGVAGYLNETLTVEQMERLAGAQSDTATRDRTLSQNKKRKENQSRPDTLGFRLISGLETLRGLAADRRQDRRRYLRSSVVL
jgi:hypothetical protein